MTDMMSRRPAVSRPHFLYPILLLGVLGVSVSAVLIRMSNAPALIIAAYRMTFTVLILMPIGVVQRETFHKYNIKLFSLSVLSGILLSLHFAVWISSLSYTSVASSTVLVTTQPVFVVLGSYFIFREKVSARALLFIATAFAGSALIGLGDFSLGSDALLGDILALSGAVFIAGYMLIGRSVRQHVDVIPYTLVVYISAAVVLILTSLVYRIPLFSYPLKEYVIFIMLAVFSTVFGHTVFNWAMRYVSAITVSTSILGEPIGASILAAVILQELPTVWQVCGGVIVILSLMLFMREQYNKSHP